MDKSVWEKVVREDANEEVMGPHNRCEGRVHTEEGEGVPIVRRRKRGDQRICEGAVEEGLYPAVKVSTNGASIFCRKKG